MGPVTRIEVPALGRGPEALDTGPGAGLGTGPGAHDTGPGGPLYGSQGPQYGF